MEESLTNKGRGWTPMAEPHRRLVCFCRLTEVQDPSKRRDHKKPGAHQRGIFLFNDLLLVTKTLASKKGRTVHQFRSKVSLSEIRVNVFSTADYPWGIQLQQRSPREVGRVLATFDARSQGDQQKFVADLQESVAETLEMEKAKMFLNDLQKAAASAAPTTIESNYAKLPVNEESLMLAPESFC